MFRLQAEPERATYGVEPKIEARARLQDDIELFGRDQVLTLSLEREQATSTRQQGSFKGCAVSHASEEQSGVLAIMAVQDESYN